MRTRITYDRSANAAYIYLNDTQVAFTYTCDPVELKGEMVNLDFDAEGHLIGIEVLNASKLIPKALLEAAEIIG